MRLLILISGLLMAGNLFGQSSRQRQLLIFSNDENVLLKQQQLNLLHKSSAGVEEREIQTVIVENGNTLFKKYEVNKAQFTVILVGKDGFEKYRTNKVLEIEQLFSIIDAMPMRKSEMKEKKNVNS